MKTFIFSNVSDPKILIYRSKSGNLFDPQKGPIPNHFYWPIKESKFSLTHSKREYVAHIPKYCSLSSEIS